MDDHVEHMNAKLIFTSFFHIFKSLILNDSRRMKERVAVVLN